MSLFKTLQIFSYFFGLLVAIQLQETGAEDAFGTYVRSKIDLDLLELLKTLLHGRIDELNDPEKVLLDPVSVKLAKKIMEIRKMEITDLPEKWNKWNNRQKRFINVGGKYFLNIPNPTTLNEKVLFTFFYYYKPCELTSWISNKLTAKLFVRDIVGAKYVARLYGVASDLDELLRSELWKKLPQKFVVKWALGCSGKRVRVVDKSDPKSIEALSALENARVSPVCKESLIVEEFLPSLQEGRTLTDYKFVCSFGKVICVIVGNAPVGPDPFSSHDKSQAVYTVPGWHILPVKYGWGNSVRVIEKPEKLDEMIEVASKLSRMFPLIRIDLYLTKDHDGRPAVKFGELTSRMGGGWAAFDPGYYDRLIGDLVRQLTWSDCIALLTRDRNFIENWTKDLRQSKNAAREVVMPGYDCRPVIHFGERLKSSIP
jgi:hypothetical protein